MKRNVDGQLQRKIVERVEYDTNFIADRTSKSRLVHASKEIGDNRVVALFIDLPAFICHFVQGYWIVDHLVGRVRLLDVGLFVNSIEILLETVKEEKKKFLRILLSPTGE